MKIHLGASDGATVGLKVSILLHLYTVDPIQWSPIDAASFATKNNRKLSYHILKVIKHFQPLSDRSSSTSRTI